MGAVDHAAAFFAGFGAIVEFVNSTIPSLHAIPTLSTGTPCGVGGNYTEGAPHGLEACGFDGAGAALAHIHGAPAGARSRFDPSRLAFFDQREFDGAEVGLDPRGGFIYVPKGCDGGAEEPAAGDEAAGGDAAADDAAKAARSPCGLHVFIHGCGQAAVSGPSGAPYAFNDTYARRAGLNEWAAAHRLVLLYPQLNYGTRARRGSGGRLLGPGGAIRRPLQ